MTKQVEQLDQVVIRIAGDSGDGMQLTGDRFTQETAMFGNDLATFPNFPAEIRAPQGTLAGVSSFQLHFADHDILTAGDRPDVLVAMNPAALKANLGDMPKGSTIIVDTHDFGERALARIGWKSNPIEDGTLESYNVHALELTELTLLALEGTELSRKDAGRSKNMFALGLLSWMYSRPTESTLEFIKFKFKTKPDIANANITAFKAGYNYGETTEAFAVKYEVKPAAQQSGTYRNISGNLGLAYGLIAAAKRADLPLFLGAYPITPASDILHELSKHKRFGIRTFQAEDEIAGTRRRTRRRCIRWSARCDDILRPWASQAQGRGRDRPAAVSLELLAKLIVDIQRRTVDRIADQDRTIRPAAGVCTAYATARRTRGAHRPCASSSPPMRSSRPSRPCGSRSPTGTPVFLLSDGYIANGSEPWQVPSVESLPDLRVEFTTEPNGEDGTFLPYLRDPDTLARPWAVPGTPGLEHRIGGIEKADKTGEISYDSDNHDFMVRTRQAKAVDRIANSLPPLVVEDPDGDAKVLVCSAGGSTFDPSVRRAARSAKPAPQSRRFTCVTSTRSRMTSARSFLATSGSSSPR